VTGSRGSGRGADGTERLCRALYGRDAEPADYLGGSEARMLHDAADMLRAIASQGACRCGVLKRHQPECPRWAIPALDMIAAPASAEGEVSDG